MIPHPISRWPGTKLIPIYLPRDGLDSKKRKPGLSAAKAAIIALNELVKKYRTNAPPET